MFPAKPRVLWLARWALLALLAFGLGGARVALADPPDDDPLELFHLGDTSRPGMPRAAYAKIYPGPPEEVRAKLAGALSPKAAPHPKNWLIPDSELVNGPSTVDFNVRAFIEAYPGYLKNHIDKVDDEEKDGAEIVELIARRYSVNPRILLALLEWKGGWLTKTEIPAIEQTYAFGYQNYYAKGLYKQLEWVANYLNAGFYAAYERNYVQVLFLDGYMPKGPVEELNQGSYAVSYFLARMSKKAEWDAARAPDGELMQTYRRLFGDPWRRVYEPLLPDGLQPPVMKLPYAAGETWWFTGAPHGGWGAGSAWGAIDFAPGLAGGKNGCWDASEWWVRASAPGRIVVTDYGEVIEDLDGDGIYQTGWSIIYNHIGRVDRIANGTWVKPGDALGHATCEGGWSSGTHVHLARRYNGVWINANGPGSIPFVISGYTVHTTAEYLGSLTRLDEEPRIAIPARVPGKNDVESDNTVVVKR